MPFGKTINTALDKLLKNLPAVDQKNPAFKPESEKSPLPRVLATAHGIMWRKHVDKIVELYRRWATNPVLPKVTIIFDTMYGSTEKMARAIFQGIAEM